MSPFPYTFRFNYSKPERHLKKISLQESGKFPQGSLVSFYKVKKSLSASEIPTIQIALCAMLNNKK